MKDWIKLFAIIPALAFTMSSSYFILFFGIGSPWLSVLTVSDYLDKAADFIPYALGTVAAMTVFAFLLSTKVTAFLNKMAIPIKRVYLIYSIVLALVIVLVPRSIVFVSSIAVTFLFLPSLSDRFAGYHKTFQEALTPRAVSLAMLALIPLVIVDTNVQFVRLSLVEFELDSLRAETNALRRSAGLETIETTERCNSYVCVEDELFIDRIEAGYLSYDRQNLILRTANGDLILTQRIEIHFARPYGCDVLTWLGVETDFLVCA